MKHQLTRRIRLGIIVGLLLLPVLDFVITEGLVAITNNVGYYHLQNFRLFPLYLLLWLAFLWREHRISDGDAAFAQGKTRFLGLISLIQVISILVVIAYWIWNWVDYSVGDYFDPLSPFPDYLTWVRTRELLLLVFLLCRLARLLCCNWPGLKEVWKDRHPWPVKLLFSFTSALFGRMQKIRSKIGKAVYAACFVALPVIFIGILWSAAFTAPAPEGLPGPTTLLQDLAYFPFAEQEQFALIGIAWMAFVEQE